MKDKKHHGEMVALAQRILDATRSIRKKRGVDAELTDEEAIEIYETIWERPITSW